jgi:hypothetical protein
MIMGRRRRLRATFGIWLALLALIGADVAAADPFANWSGTKGPFAWEAKRLGCGVVGQDASVVRAHTRWRTSPANGYMRLTFTRQIQDETTHEWATVQRQRRSTKNTSLEGFDGVVHWNQWFFPFEDEGGALSRHIVVFEWYRDRPGSGPDSRSLRRQRMFAPCVVHPG